MTSTYSTHFRSIAGMLRKAFMITTIISVIAGLSGCVNSTTADIISEARQLADNGEYKESYEICADILEHASDLSAGDYTRLALVFVQLSESDDTADQTEMVSSAAACYIKAMELNSDSVFMVITSLSQADDIRRAGLLRLLTEEPADFSDFDHDSIDPDSAFYLTSDKSEQ